MDPSKNEESCAQDATQRTKVAALSVAKVLSHAHSVCVATVAARNATHLVKMKKNSFIGRKEKRQRG